MAPEPDTFASRLQRLMDSKGFNQTTLSKKSGIERTVINRMLKGNRHPTPFEIGVLAKCLDVTPDDLMSGLQLPPQVQRAVAQDRERTERVLQAEAERDEARAAFLHLREQLDQEREEREREREEDRLGRLADRAAADAHLRNVEQYAVAQRTNAEAERARLKADLRQAASHLSAFAATANVLRSQIAALQHQVAHERSTKAGASVLGGLVGIALGRAMD